MKSPFSLGKSTNQRVEDADGPQAWPPSSNLSAWPPLPRELLAPLLLGKMMQILWIDLGMYSLNGFFFSWLTKLQLFNKQLGSSWGFLMISSEVTRCQRCTPSTSMLRSAPPADLKRKRDFSLKNHPIVYISVYYMIHSYLSCHQSSYIHCIYIYYIYGIVYIYICM